MPFNPSEFFIPGWKGEGLITASAIVIKNTLHNLTIDAEALFKKSCSTSKSMKLQTYNEFIQFAEYTKLDRSLLTQQNDFWLHVQDDSSPLKKEIEAFFKIHCFRAVAIYLFRIKFIMDLAKELHLNVTEDVLLNPLSFLGKIFVKDSSTELLCDSLQINQFSWYRPTYEYKESLLKLKEAFENITLTELIKIISTNKGDQNYSIKNYSHALSHMSFGLLVNELVIKFPTWIKPEASIKPFSHQKLCLLPKTINTRFTGNHVSSLALSHWLAQESNIKLSQWSNLICPEFDGTQFVDGEFLKICQELQFLSFLTRIAIEHKYEIIPFICKIMREKYTQGRDEPGQASFFNLGSFESTDTLYNRIVLNLTELPKTNPHHFLIQQILAQKTLLKKDAMIFVFTNQKLFVPSHSERVEQLLKDFKVEACFNMEELKGKGEIAHFAYVLSKREIAPVKNNHLFEVSRKVKESCLSFELKGNLTRFNKFNKLVEELQYFIKNKNPVTTAIYVNEVEKDIFFEFHQDAIIDGKLVSSTSNKETGHLPHPSFFKNLTRSSAPLDTFFNIELLSHEDLHQNKPNISSELLGLKLGPEKRFPLLLIVNQNDPMDVKIELTPIEAYRGKLEQYGTAFYHYFGLTPKHAINLNVFREYFSSMLGHQIIQLQLSDGPTKLKAKLKSLLIPSFFANTQFMPESLRPSYKLLDLEASELKNFHPEELTAQFKALSTFVNQHSKEYPWHILSLLSHFKLQIKSLVEELEDAKPQNFNFGNSLIANALVQLKTHAIYPKNPDVFVDYKIKNHQELQLPMTSLVSKNSEEESVLIFKFQDQEIIHFYSSPVMNSFIKFILQNATGVKISDILLNLKVPALKDLEETTKRFEDLVATKTLMLKNTEDLIAQILRTEISREN